MPRVDDPEQYRMTIGEHLEELRSRLLYGLAGFAVALVLCLVFARDQVIPRFCAPLLTVLAENDVNPQLVFSDVGEGFMVFIRISLISAAVLASPWMLYQLWRFVAAGLYPHERRTVTKYVPLSIGLLIAGMALVYWVILPWTLRFFVMFGIGMPLPNAPETIATTQPAGEATYIQFVAGNPPNPQEGRIWFDTIQKRLKVFIDEQVRVIAFGSNELLRPEISLDNYIKLVVGMLIAFALAFQLPLVVVALVRIGILDLETLKRSRRYVYFALIIVAAIITPGQDPQSLIGLTVPLCLLFELGLWLARPAKEATADRS